MEAVGGCSCPGGCLLEGLLEGRLLEGRWHDSAYENSEYSIVGLRGAVDAGQADLAERAVKDSDISAQPGELDRLKQAAERFASAQLVNPGSELGSRVVPDEFEYHDLWGHAKRRGD